MSEALALAGGALLLLLLAFLALKSVLGAGNQENPLDGAPDEIPASLVCPAEFVERIFSDEDREYIRELNSTKLKKQFDKERTTLAVLWVRLTAAGIRHIMCEHKQSARKSPDLRSVTEIHLWLQYCALLWVCGTLLVLIRLAGPFWLRSLASYAQRLSEKIAEGRGALTAAMVSHSTDARRL